MALHALDVPFVFDTLDAAAITGHAAAAVVDQDRGGISGSAGKRDNVLLEIAAVSAPSMPGSSLVARWARTDRRNTHRGSAQAPQLVVDAARALLASPHSTIGVLRARPKRGKLGGGESSGRMRRPRRSARTVPRRC
jgi:hypothetical protein